MKRLLFSVFLMLVVSGCGSSSDVTSQSSFTIGIINPVDIREQVVTDFQATMTELGYIEGENVTYIYEGALPDADERLAWAEQLVEQGVDLIFAVATPGAVSAATATDSIPVVFVPVTDPVGAGVVESLQNPGGNVTGVTNGNPHALRMQFLIDVLPDIDIIYAPHNYDSPPAINSVPSILAVAEENNVNVIAPDVRTPEEIEAALADIPEGTDAIFVLPDPTIANALNEFIDEATALGLPIIHLSRSEVENGALLAYGEELDAAAAQAARMVDVILQGANPADLPVETTEYFLSLNLATAEAIGIDISDDFLQRVNFIIRDED